MKHAALIDELERLGSLPTPVPDRARVSAWEHQLYEAFESAPIEVRPVRRAPQAQIRRRRRQLLVAGLAVAAAVSAAVVAVHRNGRPDLELQAASGAVVVLPDGSSMPIHSGDRIPPGGVIQTGAGGSVTIGGTRVGPGQAVLVDSGHLTLLPETSPSTVPASSAPPSTATATTAASSTKPRTNPARSTAPPVVTQPANSTPHKPAKAPPAAPVPAAPPPASAAAPTPSSSVAPAPADGVLGLTVGRVGSGIQLSWTSPNVAPFGRYVIARAAVSPARLVGIAVLTDEQITSFIDPAAPHGVEVFYRVVALGTNDRLLAKSEIVSLIVEQSTPTTTTTLPASSSTTVATTTPTTSTTSTSSTTTPSTTSSSSPPTSQPPTSEPPTSEPSRSDPSTSAPAPEPRPTEGWRPHR